MISDPENNRQVHGGRGQGDRHGGAAEPASLNTGSRCNVRGSSVLRGASRAKKGGGPSDGFAEQFMQITKVKRVV